MLLEDARILCGLFCATLRDFLVFSFMILNVVKVHILLGPNLSEGDFLVVLLGIDLHGCERVCCTLNASGWLGCQLISHSLRRGLQAFH